MKQLIWSNIARRRGQSLLTIAITALTVFSFVVVLGVCATMDQGLTLSRERLGADVVLIPEHAAMNEYDLLFTANPENIYMPADTVQKAAAIEGAAKCSAQFYSQTISGASCCSADSEIRVVGFDPSTDFILTPYFTNKTLGALADDEVVVGSSLPSFGNSAFLILGRRFKTVGSLYPTGTGMDSTIFMNIDTARQITMESEMLKDTWKDKNASDYISVVMVKLAEGTDAAAFESAVKKAGLGVQCVATRETIAALQDQLNVTMRVFLLLWAAVMIIAALSLFGRFHALARERRREIGLMRALGVRKKRIFGLIVGEALVMAIIGGLAGGVLGCLLAGPVMAELQKAFYLNASLWTFGGAELCCLSGLLLSCALSFLAAILPASASAALEPQTAIMQGEIN